MKVLWALIIALSLIAAILPMTARAGPPWTIGTPTPVGPTPTPTPTVAPHPTVQPSAFLGLFMGSIPTPSGNRTPTAQFVENNIEALETAAGRCMAFQPQFTDPYYWTAAGTNNWSTTGVLTPSDPRILGDENCNRFPYVSWSSSLPGAGAPSPLPSNNVQSLMSYIPAAIGEAAPFNFPTNYTFVDSGGTGGLGTQWNTKFMDAFAQRAKLFPGILFIRPFHEFDNCIQERIATKGTGPCTGNGDTIYNFPLYWPPSCSSWPPANQAAYAATCTLTTIAEEEELFQLWFEYFEWRVNTYNGATNVVFAWNPTNANPTTTSGYLPTTCYITAIAACPTYNVGNATPLYSVDYLSDDAYDNSGNNPYASVIGTWFNTFSAYGLPLFLIESGSPSQDVTDPSYAPGVTAGCVTGGSAGYTPGPYSQYSFFSSWLSQYGTYPWKGMSVFSSWSTYPSKCGNDWNLDTLTDINPPYGRYAFYTDGCSSTFGAMSRGTPAPTCTPWPTPTPTPTAAPTLPPQLMYNSHEPGGDLAGLETQVSQMQSDGYSGTINYNVTHANLSGSNSLTALLAYDVSIGFKEYISVKDALNDSNPLTGTSLYNDANIYGLAASCVGQGYSANNQGILQCIAVNFGSSAAFGGWYIYDEPGCPNQSQGYCQASLAGKDYRGVNILAAYIASVDTHPILGVQTPSGIPPYTGGWANATQGQAQVAHLYSCDGQTPCTSPTAPGTPYPWITSTTTPYTGADYYPFSGQSGSTSGATAPPGVANAGQSAGDVKYIESYLATTYAANYSPEKNLFAPQAFSFYVNAGEGPAAGCTSISVCPFPTSAQMLTLRNNALYWANLDGYPIQYLAWFWWPDITCLNNYTGCNATTNRAAVASAAFAAFPTTPPP